MIPIIPLAPTLPSLPLQLAPLQTTTFQSLPHQHHPNQCNHQKDITPLPHRPSHPDSRARKRCNRRARYTWAYRSRAHGSVQQWHCGRGSVRHRVEQVALDLRDVVGTGTADGSAGGVGAGCECCVGVREQLGRGSRCMDLIAGEADLGGWWEFNDRVRLAPRYRLFGGTWKAGGRAVHSPA